LPWTGTTLARAQNTEAETEQTLKLIAMINGQLGAVPIFGAGIVIGREKDRLYIVTKGG
jgi:hypothetical protein